MGINKTFKIIFKKYKFIIATFLLVSLFFNISSFNMHTKSIDRNVSYDVSHVDDYLKFKSDKDAEKYWQNNEYGHTIDPIKRDNIKKEEVEKLSIYFNKTASKNNSKEYKEFRNQLSYTTNNYIDAKNNLFNGSKILTEEITSFMIFAVIIAFIVSSDYMTNFYKFMRQLPVKRENIYLTKFLNGLIISIFYLLICLLFKYFILKNSLISEVLNFDELYKNVILNILKVSVFYSAAMGFGTLAGNAIGFIGMLIISTLFSEVILLIMGFVEFFTKLELSTPFIKFINSLPDIVNVPLSLAESIIKRGNILVFLIWTIIYFLIGYVITKKSDGSRITKCIVFKKASNVIKYLAILATTSALILLSNTIFEDSIFIYPFSILFLYISYKFYNMLFELNIGF